MAEYKKGYLAVSKAGHDKQEIYVIIDWDASYIYLSDGKYKKLDNPKKKNHRHVQVIQYMDRDIEQKLENSQLLINEDIKKAIKNYLCNIKENDKCQKQM